MEAGEFRAPGMRGHGFDGPGEWRFFCLQHVREFNDGYDWFEGMSADEVIAAQSPAAGWQTETRTFRADAGIDGMPRWADFDDPLDAIGMRASEIKGKARANANNRGFAAGSPSRFAPAEREALKLMGLAEDADKAALRRRYTRMVRLYHPDQNGGDRSQEDKLNMVVEAYQLLRRARGMN